ncbi:MAG: transcription antitermination factor NusB [Prevotella sp.]|nr:transcription antitermination factor NusB [Prevotella sp.]MBR5062073.1 transcription antitermination factor NusB [Prevotella sp.]
MINRELIRIKIVQLTYAYYQNGEKNMDSAEKELLFSLSKTYYLYNFLLLLIVAVSREERHRVEIAAQRAEREGGEAPSEKFINNKFALQLEENKMLKAFFENENQAWEEHIEYVRKLCNHIEESEVYLDYMESADNSYAADKEVWRKLYKQLVTKDEDIDAILEDKSIYWNDDKAIVDTFVLKTINQFNEENGANQPLLAEYNDEEEKLFARKLFRAAILNAESYHRYMSETSRNWDFGRLAYMDVVIMQIAIAEMMSFPSIPISVTINEYVDLAKVYSTPRSGGYINGMLDSIARYLVKNGRLKKVMNDPKQQPNN